MQTRSCPLKWALVEEKEGGREERKEKLEGVVKSY